MYLQPRKACPCCHTAAPLAAAQCLACGHEYRTLFVTPHVAPLTNRTRKIYAFAATKSDSKIVHLALSLCLAIMAVAAIQFGMQTATQTAPIRSHSYHRTDLIRRNDPVHVAKNQTVTVSGEPGK